MNKLITIVVPTYNEKEELLRKAIESILNQTYSEIELIVVDDGSTDDTPRILKEYGKDIRMFRRERDSEFRSVSHAFNIGLENAKGGWWHHDAADCYHELEWAERCMDFVTGREDIVIGVHTDFAVHHFDEQIEHVKVEQRWQPGLSSLENYRRHECLGGMIFQMDACKKAGSWDIRFPRKQTREWTMRVLQLGNLAYIPRELWHFVFHESNQMKRNASVKYRILGDLKNGFDIQHNMGIAFGAENGRYAMVEAMRTFFTAPEWEKERLSGKTFDLMERAKKICDEEASEQWER